MLVATIIGGVGMLLGLFGYAIGRHDKTIINQLSKGRIDNWGERSVLDDVAFTQLMDTLKSTKYWYGKCTLESIIGNGYRFSCAQIYAIRRLAYQGEHWGNTEGVNDDDLKILLAYNHTCAVEGREKARELIESTEARVLAGYLEG